MPYDHNDVLGQARPELQLNSQWSDLYWSDVRCILKTGFGCKTSGRSTPLRMPMTLPTYQVQTLG